MNFDEHLERHRRTDGSYDLDAAEDDRRHELETHPDELRKLAAKVAHQERAAWTNQETAKLRKQFEQAALSPTLELGVMVPLGNGSVVPLGDMNHVRIRTRKDMRLTAHLNEQRAFTTEMTHWLRTEALLAADETVEIAIVRMVTA